MAAKGRVIHSAWVTPVLGLGGEEERQGECEREDAGVPGVENGTQSWELSPTPAGCLPLSPTVGGSGSRIVGLEAKAGSQASGGCQAQGARVHPGASFLVP